MASQKIGAWQATMTRLDAEAEVAHQPRHVRRLAPAEVVEYLRSLPSLWTDFRTRRTPGARLCAVRQARSGGIPEDDLRTHVRCRGCLGLDAALPATYTLEERGFGRGARGSASKTHVPGRPRFVLENVTGPPKVWRDATGKPDDPQQRPTRRQLEVLRAYIAAGSIAAAAYELGISETTARQHLSGLYRRTGCLNAAQAACWLGTRQLDCDATLGRTLPPTWQ